MRPFLKYIKCIAESLKYSIQALAKNNKKSKSNDLKLFPIRAMCGGFYGALVLFGEKF